MQKFVGMCFNWKVVVGLIGVGLGVVVLAPALIAPVLPLLLLAACPLSMMAMMWGMHAGKGEAESPTPHTTLPAPGESLTLADLTAQRTVLQAHQDQIARAIAILERNPAPAEEAPEITGSGRNLQGVTREQIVR